MQIVESREKKSGGNDPNGPVRVSLLNLVDLAGSERAKATRAYVCYLSTYFNVFRC